MSLPEEMLLCRAVLYRALQDALGYGCNKQEKQEALYWCCFDTEGGFCNVCDMAGLDPDWVRNKLNAALKLRKNRKQARKLVKL